MDFYRSTKSYILVLDDRFNFGVFDFCAVVTTNMHGDHGSPATLASGGQVDGIGTATHGGEEGIKGDSASTKRRTGGHQPGTILRWP